MEGDGTKIPSIVLLERGFERLTEVIEEVVGILQSDAQADGGGQDVHLGLLFGREADEDGGIGVDGERLIVEEIGGTQDELQVVDQAVTGSLALELDGHHGAACLAELPTCQRVIGMALQADVAHLAYLWQRLQPTRQGQRIG